MTAGALLEVFDNFLNVLFVDRLGVGVLCFTDGSDGELELGNIALAIDAQEHVHFET